MKWVRSVLKYGMSDKTIVMNSKTVCGTGRLTEDGRVLHITNALVSELNLVIGR